MYCCTGRSRCGSWCSGLVGEPYRMVSLERDSSENEVEGTEVRIGMSNDFPHHVWCINNGDSEEHVSGQCENGHLMLYGVRGEGEYGAEVRCMGCGSQHKMSFGAFGGKTAAGEASGDGKALRGPIGAVPTITCVQ